MGKLESSYFQCIDINKSGAKIEPSLSLSPPPNSIRVNITNACAQVCKPPPDTKKPPALLQNPCQFSSTQSIYGSPKSDLIKVAQGSSRRGYLRAFFLYILCIYQSSYHFKHLVSLISMLKIVVGP